MELKEKLKILADSAKYDVSCSSSGSSRKNNGKGMGNSSVDGICHSWSEDGRCISLLKILLTNRCVFDCQYCINRRSLSTERTEFSVEEVVYLTREFYRRNYIEGLFLSSGIFPTVDETMEKLIAIVKQLRETDFNGYIHAKAIPGSDPRLIRELGRYVDRLSANIELPTAKGLMKLAPQKTLKQISGSMEEIKEGIFEHQESKRKSEIFVPAGQTTQMIIGATGESDREIILTSEHLYQKMELKRVYYSAYVPAAPSRILGAVKESPMLREHRLYQGDFLLRFYGFQGEEILGNEQPYFDLDIDPKANWALSHYGRFPIEVNRACYEELLRVPGFGPKSCRKIIDARRVLALRPEDLKKLRISLKRAKYFITVGGKYMGTHEDEPETIRRILSAGEKNLNEQLSFF